jgi:hypothetical protein
MRRAANTNSFTTGVAFSTLWTGRPTPTLSFPGWPYQPYGRAANTNTINPGVGLFNPLERAANTNTLLPGAGLINAVERAAITYTITPGAGLFNPLERAANTNAFFPSVGLFNSMKRAANTNAIFPGVGLFNPMNRAANTNAPTVLASVFGFTASLAPGVLRLPCDINIIASNRGYVVYVNIRGGLELGVGVGGAPCHPLSKNILRAFPPRHVCTLRQVGGKIIRIRGYVALPVSGA